MSKEKYRSLSVYLKEEFKEKVFKVTLDGGFSCPNKDGTVSSLAIDPYAGCTYCEVETIRPLVTTDGKPIDKQLSDGIEKVAARHKAKKFIAYFQINSNTHAKPEKLRALYKEALSDERVALLAVSTRPDCINEEIVELLKEVSGDRGLWVELGLQSANDETLKRINRGHTVEDFQRAHKLLSQNGIKVCAHVIAGLPGEGKEDFLKTIRFLNELKVWGVKFHQLQVLKNTALEEMYKKGDLKLLSLEEYSEIVVESIEALSPEVVIHRLSGDVPKEFLIAPKWGVNKFIIKETIDKKLEERNSRQGSSFVEDKKVKEDKEYYVGRSQSS